MKIYIATDWYKTMCFDIKPTYTKVSDSRIDGEKMEWMGHRVPVFDQLIPADFKQKVGDICEAEVVLNIKTENL